jgi:sugar/nucleoside kinase (ribokinase family)
MSELEVLSVGDVVTDAFIKLEDDQAWISDGEHGKILSMPFGMKVPYEGAEVLEGVGNAANAAVAFARLGLTSGLVSNVGDDAWGRDILKTLKQNQVDTRFVHINPDKVSNYHYVLRYKEERTILIKHETYDYHWPRFRQADEPKWVYFSSIAENAIEHYHDDIADWLEENPEIKLAFQPGTYQMNAGVERLARLYGRSEVVILNREEAVLVFGGNYDDMHDLFNRMHGSGIKVAVITDGPSGAYASSGDERYKMPPYPDPAPPKERTGAGDAFSSTFVAALMAGEPLTEALRWGPINSMSVVQAVGAQAGLLSRDKLIEYLHTAPDWYQPERF